MEQNFANHTKLVPLFHFFVLPIFALDMIWCIVRFVRHVSVDNLISMLLLIALFTFAGLSRTFALKVQDRVIRLEMRLRLLEILPAELRPRISELTIRQLIALRFASDQEMTALVQKVLSEKIKDGKTIKSLVQNWQADNARA
jgi:hypothetical protein